MRVLLVLLIAFSFAGFLQAMTVEEIGRLSDLKTGDELMLQLIQKDGLDKPLTTADAIYLREHGTSERVIQYLLVLSEKKKPAEQPSVQEESTKVSDNLRAYTTTTKAGKKIRVVTNLDEQGNRMGEPVPPPPPEPEAAPAPPPSQEVHVTVSDERISERRYGNEEDYGYQEEPQPSGGIPLYSGAYYPSYYPSYSWASYPYPMNGTGFWSGRGMHGGRPGCNTPHWRSATPTPLVRPQLAPRAMPQAAPRAASLGVRRSR